MRGSHYHHYRRPGLALLALLCSAGSLASASGLLAETGAARTEVGTVTATTSKGAVTGVVVQFEDPRLGSVNVFRGIPFAATTGGSNRWRPPQPAPAWAPAVLNGTANSFGCQQPHHNPDVPCDGKAGPRCQSEDCLNVNVYCSTRATTAASLDAGAQPVMVWYHGGSFDEGSNRGPFNVYDGAHVAAAAQSGVCVVGANYRLGVLGALVAQGEGDASRGNHGLRDQRAALVWVQAEIKHFGGDPGRVTIWGESAGAMSVLLVSFWLPPRVGVGTAKRISAASSRAPPCRARPGTGSPAALRWLCSRPRRPGPARCR